MSAVTQVRLVRDGVEKGPAYAVVSVYVDGQWIEVIRENVDGQFSHYVNLDISGIVTPTLDAAERAVALLRECHTEFLTLIDTDDPTVYNDYLEHLKGIQSRIAKLLATASEAP